ncbi:hypothetical protein [Paenibacillus pini]|nr:hypothetical protein [Paenibacillus pini]
MDFQYRGSGSSQHIPPPNRIAASRFAPLRWWDVVDTETLSETSAI